MPQSQDLLGHIDDVIAHFNQALEAIQQIPKGSGEEVLKLDGIEHVMVRLGERLRSLRAELAADSDGADRAE
jgi:hypothetical protein